MGKTRSHPLSNLILLRANYNKDLYDAILREDQNYLDKWFENYKVADDVDELDNYNNETLDVIILKKKLVRR